MEQLGTDSCRGTVPMEPPMPNCSMGHQNPDLDFDDTGHFLQGALRFFRLDVVESVELCYE